MARRRGHGEGSISQRADGRWHVRVDLGRGVDGRRRRKSGYATTEAEAVRLLRRLGGRVVEGQLRSTTTPTVATFLEEWFATHADDWRPSTQRSYRLAIDLYLVPAFGPVRLEQLSRTMVQHWLTAHKEQYGARRRITHAHAALRSALSFAQQLELVTYNVARALKISHPEQRPIVTLEVAQATRFLEVASQHRLYALFSVALATGLRLGEVTGLQWDDIDLDTGDLQIVRQLQAVKGGLVLQEPKTEKSHRQLTLPRVCLDALRQHRQQQREERLKAGPRWIDSGLVFTGYGFSGRRTQPGRGLHPRSVLHFLHRLLRAADLPPMRFHDLRHSAASLLLAQGVQLAEISKLLGHSKLATTSDLYSHLQRETSAKAARIMDAILTPAKF